MFAQVYFKQARKSKKGVFYAPGMDSKGYMLFKLCENYDGQCKGGIRKTWRYVADRMTLDECKALFEKRLGYNLYDSAE